MSRLGDGGRRGRGGELASDVPARVDRRDHRLVGGESVPLANDSAIRRAASTASRRLSLCGFPLGRCARGSTLRGALCGERHDRPGAATLFRCSTVTFAGFMFISPVGAIVAGDGRFPARTLGVTRPGVVAWLRPGPRCSSVTSGYFRSSDRIAVVMTSATTAPRPTCDRPGPRTRRPTGAGRRQAIRVRPHVIGPRAPARPDPPRSTSSPSPAGRAARGTVASARPSTRSGRT